MPPRSPFVTQGWYVVIGPGWGVPGPHKGGAYREVEHYWLPSGDEWKSACGHLAVNMHWKDSEVGVPNLGLWFFGENVCLACLGHYKETLAAEVFGGRVSAPGAEPFRDLNGKPLIGGD